MRYSSIFKFRDRTGKGVKKDENNRPTLKNFPKIFGRKFSHLLSLNLLMLFQVLPIIVALMAFFMFTATTPSQTSPIFAPLHGVSLIAPNAVNTLTLALDSLPLSIPAFQPTSYWVVGACALFLLLTLGWQMVGSTYVLRNLVRGDAVFVFSDYFYAIKRNLRQGFVFGLADCAIIVALVVDFLFYSQQVGAFWMDVLFWILSAIAVLYMIMRPYIYMMMVTFDMKIKKMFKNALIFSALGIKRNIMAGLGIVLLLLFHLALIILIPPTIIIPVIVPILYVFAAIGFISAYAIYPVIDRYMIAPYRQDAENDGEDNAQDEQPA